MSQEAHLSAASAGGRTGPERGPMLAAMAGLFGALLASSCCILPIALFGLGIGGAWIGNFTQLAPYKPFFVAGTAAALGIGYWLVHRASKRACAEGEACARPLPGRAVRAVLIAATILVIAAFTFDYLAPYILPY